MISYLYLFTLLVGLPFCASLVCLKCDNVHRSIDCQKVATCQTGEVCFIEKDINGNGFNLGCRSQQICQNSSQPTCTGCCNSNACNKDLCSIPGSSQTGPLCYGCDHLVEIEDCNKIIQCPSNQACYTTVSNNPTLGLAIHTHGCKAKVDCPATGNYRSDGCDSCCIGDLCNNQATNCTSSAVTVRFLTKRFIGEYSSEIDLMYRSRLKQEDYLTDIKLLDTCTKSVGVPSAIQVQHFINSRMDFHVQWADAFVVVYDISRKSTFEEATKILDSLAKMRSPFIVPILLLGNKQDLDHRREVGVDEGHELALENSCQFYEVSASETFTPISVAFQALLRDAKITQQQRSNILRRRRSSLLTVSKKLGSIFGKKETDTERKRPSCDVADFALSI